MITKTYLLEKHQELIKFHTVQCELVHERVVLSLSEEGVSNEPCQHVKRLGFCNANLRKWRLGCAHTMANNNFIRLVSNLISSAEDALADLPLDKVKDLVYQIYLLDHTKGSLEKQKALIRKCENERLVAVKADLEEVIAKHKTLVAELENCREIIIKRLDQLIALS